MGEVVENDRGRAMDRGGAGVRVRERERETEKGERDFTSAGGDGRRKEGGARQRRLSDRAEKVVATWR